MRSLHTHRNNTRERKPRQIIVKLLEAKLKGKIWKHPRCFHPGAGEHRGDTLLKGATIRLTSEFSTEMIKVRKSQHDIFKVFKVNICPLEHWGAGWGAGIHQQWKQNKELFRKTKIQKVYCQRLMWKEIIQGFLWQKENDPKGRHRDSVRNIEQWK